MQQSSGIILILTAFLIIYIILAGKYAVFEEFFYKLFNLTSVQPTSGAIGVNPAQGVIGVTERINAIQAAIDAAKNAARPAPIR